MIDANSRTNTFLSSIKKYALEQSNQLHNEAEEFKEKELQRIKNNALEEASAMYARETVAIRAKIASEMAHKYDESKVALFEKRTELTNNVYNAAASKLTEFAKSEKYAEYMRKSAQEVSSVVNANDVIVYIKKDDSEYSDMLNEIFSGKCRVEVDDEIKIGGIKVHCPALKIIADETLEGKLMQTKDWFMENSGLIIF